MMTPRTMERHVMERRVITTDRTSSRLTPAHRVRGGVPREGRAAGDGS
jgi:hypothetical protein